VKTAESQQTGAAARPPQRPSMPSLDLNNGSVEVLKWLALILMTGDHVNKYILDDAYPILFTLGRIASPIFCFVLAFNLARPNTLERGVYIRTITRLILFASIASIPFIALGSMKQGYIFFGWWPLNILATLMVATSCIYFLDRGGKFDKLFFVLTFIIGGAIGEFWWPAILLCVSTWLYCRRPSWTWLTVAIVSTAAFVVINQNFWALAALPIIFGAQFLKLNVGRTKLFFYVFYPAHLAIIWFITRIIIS
jgi:hypothetical protein